MQKGIYAIYDKKAQDAIGPLHLFAHQAAAIRFFGDVASLENSQIRRYPEDFALVRVGTINLGDDADTATLTVQPGTTTILEGATWAAMGNPTNKEN